MSTTDDEDPGPGRDARATVAFQTVGCKLNQAESESLARKFLSAGFSVVAPDKNPDVYILNTCTVTHIADRKCRQHLRSFHRRDPGALVLAIGCYVDRAAAEVQVEGVDLAIGNADKGRIIEMVEAQLGEESISNRGNGHHAPLAPFRTRALVMVQDGCNQHCSYCIVPHVRGRERSVPGETVIAEVKARANEGCKEVILTGTRIGAYGGVGGLEGLVQRILDETTIPRLRLSSLQPRELSPSLIRLWRDNERVCRHLHLALQSGSDAALKRMGREYSISEYEVAVNAVRDAIPDIAITTDVIVGFPGESEEEFEESYRFCERMGFARLHVFPYSARPSTLAARMPNRVPEKTKKTRSQIMLKLAKRSTQDFRRRFQGETMPVLWEERKKDHLWIGHTDNYLKVITRSDEPLHNCLLNTRLGSEYEDALWGDIPRMSHCTLQNANIKMNLTCNYSGC